MKRETYETIKKVLTIIIVVLFFVENFILVWVFYDAAEEGRKMRTCYYESCKEYPDALYEGGVCTCYDYDVLGNEIVADYFIIE